MEIKALAEKAKGVVSKYKYAILILIIGLALLMLPKNEVKQPIKQSIPEATASSVNNETLAEILQSIHGAGKVQVMLSTATGERTIYQSDRDTSTDSNGSTTKSQTVIITDSQRGESGLVTQVDPPTYLGAIVVCQGADSAAVKFAVTQAVAKITGLGTDRICVLKMK